MWTTIHKAFSDCLERIKGGEAVNSCLARYPHERQQIAPLLFTALSISAVPKVVPSEEFGRQSTDRLLARLLAVSRQTEKSHPARLALDGLAIIWRGLLRAFTGPARVTVPLALGLILALQCLFLFGAFNFVSRPATGALASQGTLSILKGSIQLQVPGSTTWEEAKDGITVLAGSRVKTDLNAQALLTFFNGTTVTLEPSTDLVVEQAKGSDSQPTVIVLKQWVGKTLSRVTKLADAAAHYEIKTPSATALVRGTLFVTEVDEKGATRLQTIEGLVGVSGQGVEVGVAAGQQTTVEPGGTPSKPALMSPGEKPSGQGVAGGAVPGTGPASTGGSNSAGQNIKTENSRQQGKEGLPAPTPNTKDQLGQAPEELSWRVQYDTWTIANFIGAILYLSLVALLIWRRNR